MGEVGKVHVHVYPTENMACLRQANENNAKLFICFK